MQQMVEIELAELKRKCKNETEGWLALCFQPLREKLRFTFLLSEMTLYSLAEQHVLPHWMGFRILFMDCIVIH